MKRNHVLTGFFILLLTAALLTACGRSEFGVTEYTGKRMTITAVNAAQDSFFMTGSLAVAEGEQVVISSQLTKGKVLVELVEVPEEQGIDSLPQINGMPVLTANVGPAEEASGTVPAGSYLLKATCNEKANGSVLVEVTPAA